MDDLTSIIDQLKDHEKRISALEGNLTSNNLKTTSKVKELTITELVKGEKFHSGQKKIATIVGYCEKILKLEKIDEGKIKNNWVNGKFDGKYRSNFIERAVGDGLIRDLEDGTYDLSQTGESFFEELLHKNNGKTQS
ncbi:MAG: hypothetical protein QY322_02185 [bacterium]|nr:MAG: hypothetical protein QY322_02185 [bacterium]